MLEKKINEDLHNVVGGAISRLAEDSDIKWYTREQVGSSLGPLIKFEVVQKYFNEYVWVCEGGRYTKAKLDEYGAKEAIGQGRIPLEWDYHDGFPFEYLVHHEDVLLYQYIDTGLELKAPNL